jgi:hypothetical protein
VDEYGYLFGGEESFPVDVTQHDWESPYPTFDALAKFEWAAGESGSEPNIFRIPGSYTDLFLGDLLKAALDEAEIAGLGYTPVAVGVE